MRMPKIAKYFKCLYRRPFGLSASLVSSLLISIFLTFSYPPSVAYSKTYKIFFPFVSSSQTSDIILAWDPNQDPDLAGYKLYIGKSSLDYTQVINVGLTTQYTINILMDGTPIFFALTAYNQKGFESGFSNEVQYP
jgi:hypothetical protein